MSAVTFSAIAYLGDYMRLDEVVSGKTMPQLSMGRSEYYEREGYPVIGTATVTLELISKDKMVQGQLDALNVQLQNERAESQRRQNAILDRISKLQALEFAA